MKKIFLLLACIFLIIACNSNNIGINNVKLYDYEPVEVIDSVLSIYSISNTDLYWVTQNYKEYINGSNINITVATALYRTQTDSTLILTEIVYPFKTGTKYKFTWRIEKENNINY